MPLGHPGAQHSSLPAVLKSLTSGHGGGQALVSAAGSPCRSRLELELMLPVVQRPSCGSQRQSVGVERGSHQGN